MPNQYFQFKQFRINQENCAMKVGTDGVLLGAWAEVENTKQILDIGTGTGLLALMLAQRTNAIINAIEIDEHAYRQACKNIRASKWKSRISVKHMGFEDFLHINDKKYDLVVSNPPYFEKSLLSTNVQKNTARHTQSLSYKNILQQAKNILSPYGKVCLILPSLQEESCETAALESGLFLNEKLWVKPTPEISPARVLLNFSFNKRTANENTIVIEEGGRHQYSDAYKKLTGNFYLEPAEKYKKNI